MTSDVVRALEAGRNAQDVQYAGKSLAERMTGRFYTPEIVANLLARRIVRELGAQATSGQLGPIVRVTDPFSGDGRLVAALLQEIGLDERLAHRKCQVLLRDLDESALREGRLNVRSVSRAFGLDVSVRAVVGDTLASDPKATMDVVVTNPPWELLKPDRREIASMTTQQREAHVGYLRARCIELDARFPYAKADKSYAGWGTNLARCGTEFSVRSCRAGGVVGIVLPATLMADQASMTLRRSLVDQTALLGLSVFPAEARLFARVDQPVVAATFIVQPKVRRSANVEHFTSDCRLGSKVKIDWSHRSLERRNYSIGVTFGGARVAEIEDRLIELPCFGDLEGKGSRELWAGRELDETRLAAKLHPRGSHPFVKGRMVVRHGITERPSQFVKDELAEKIRSRSFERVVWRDVARSSQQRRMIGTIIPPSWIAGNSLHVAHFRDGDTNKLRALQAILSSLVFEFQVRSRLGTGHMSLGIIRGISVPKFDSKLVRRLSNLASDVLTQRSETAEIKLEISVAKAYGLDREAMAALIGEFPKLPPSYVTGLLDSQQWKKVSA